MPYLDENHSERNGIYDTSNVFQRIAPFQFFVSIKDRGEHKRQAPMIQKAAYKKRNHNTCTF